MRWLCLHGTAAHAISGKQTLNLATLDQSAPREWALGGSWTVRFLGELPKQLDQLDAQPREQVDIVLDGSKLEAIDSTGAWVLRSWLQRQNAKASFSQWQPRLQTLMELVCDDAKRVDIATAIGLNPPTTSKASPLDSIGHTVTQAAGQGLALLMFIGQTASTASHLVRHPQRIRWRALLRNIQVAGFEALPIIGLTSFLLGVVVAYQGADQLKHYGANIFVVDLVGYSMLREFAPLITAIIVSGRSGSAYAAQIGTMVVTDEIDAMRTIDIDPIELLVLPKIAGLAVALPLLTAFADITGVIGGMVMARSQLGIGFNEFIDRFGREIHGPELLVGIGKALVFAIIIAVIGCFQGFRTEGSADSVGRQTTISVVQSIFIVIVADALFSIVFNLLHI